MEIIIVVSFIEECGGEYMIKGLNHGKSFVLILALGEHSVVYLKLLSIMVIDIFVIVLFESRFCYFLAVVSLTFISVKWE